MTWPNEDGTRKYDLEIDEDTHWGLVSFGAQHRMHEEIFAEFILKTIISDFYAVEKGSVETIESDAPLYRRMQQELDLYGSMWRPKLTMMLAFLADVIEQRGAEDLDRDPGETADWLRQEAKKVLEAEEEESSDVS